MVDKGNTDKHRTGITGNGLKGLSKVVEQSKWGHNTAEKGMENSTPRLHLRLIEAVRNSSRTRVSRVQAIPLTAGFVATGRTLTFNEPSLSSSDHAPADTTSSRSDGAGYYG